MSSILFTLAVISALATLGVLILGVSGMVRGTDFYRRNSNKLMRLRVILQGVTIVLLLLAMMAASQH